ncbi:hypothetical protein [Scytonema millei]|uniref:Spore coat protein U domain-containing protein n=1 Tax=Scytonema millei VB511283 TaxID=1245923 RepID=A0A9X5I5P5_9CYAN|nr:hypothetical protein [Scytonema millei]NHC35924.1 hypothetical protein [Scytonema millei VB511283]
MNWRLALAGSLAVLSTASLMPVANAAPTTQDIPFNGTVAGSCVFSGTVGGTLGQVMPKYGWVEASGGIPGMAANLPAGQTMINCNSPAQLSTSVPVAVSVPASFNPQKLQSLVYDGINYTTAYSGGSTFDSGAWNKPTTPIAIPMGVDVPLQVGMVAGTRSFTSDVPSGTYEYTVTLTATPN